MKTAKEIAEEMDNYKFDYWKEALECALDGAGLFGTIPGDKLDSITKSLCIASEQTGMAFGHDCISNPLVVENEKLQKRVEQLLNHACEWREHSRSAYMSGERDDVYSHCTICGKTKHERG